jgi:hypothetical protein
MCHSLDHHFPVHPYLQRDPNSKSFSLPNSSMPNPRATRLKSFPGSRYVKQLLSLSQKPADSFRRFVSFRRWKSPTIYTKVNSQQAHHQHQHTKIRTICHFVIHAIYLSYACTPINPDERLRAQKERRREGSGESSCYLLNHFPSKVRPS